MGVSTEVDLRGILGLPYRAGGVDPWDGVDCLWAARAALGRIFPDLRAEELPLEKDAALALMRGHGSSWKHLRWPSEVGDVVYGVHPEPWVATLVNRQDLIVFTALPRRGTCAVPLRKLGKYTDVLRRGP
jgi:hypothetical protein